MNPIIRTTLQCYECSYNTKNKTNLRSHIINNHLRDVQTRKVKCSDCRFVCCSRSQLINHLSKKHNMEFKEECLIFESYNEFLRWKTKIEADNLCRYVTKSGFQKLLNGQRIRRYYCHRDGYFHSSVNVRKKLLKSQGSNKINSSCPAQIICRENVSGTVNVKFISVHHGHDSTNIGRLVLTNNERASIAEKIKTGVDFANIMDDIRNNIWDLRTAEVNISKQDLRNIVRDFRLDPSRNHCSDAVNVELNDENIVSVELNDENIVSVELNDENIVNVELNDEYIVSDELNDENIVSVELDDDENIVVPLNEVFESPENRPGELERLCCKFESILGFLRKHKFNSLPSFSEKTMSILSRKADQILDIVAQTSMKVSTTQVLEPSHKKISKQVKFVSTKNKRNRQTNAIKLSKSLPSEAKKFRKFLMDSNSEEIENVNSQFDHIYTNTF